MHGTESGKSLQLKMGKVDEKEARNKKEARNRAPVIIPVGRSHSSGEW